MQHTSLNTIFGRRDDTAVDPVCHMTVDKKNPPGGTAQHAGQTYYFCAVGCRHAFEREPAKYAKA